MAKIIEMFHNLFSKNTVVYSPQNKKGDNKSNHVKVANSMVNNELHFHINEDNKQFEEVYESVINKSSTIEFREKILPIETLISEGKPLLAIKEYEALILSNQFGDYSKKEKLLIYNGLLNCFINVDADDEIIKKWTLKIETLGNEVEGIHRYYFLMSVWNYNKRKLNRAKVYNEQAIKAKSNYINALVFDVLLKSRMKKISYDEAKRKLKEILKDPNLKINEQAIVYGGIGDVAFNNLDFPYAKECYIKSNEYVESLHKKIGIATCDYFDSIINVRDDRTVTLDDIDYNKLFKAKEKFETIYNAKTEETMPTISRLMFPYYFTILSVTNNHKKIIEIVNESKSFIDFTEPEILLNLVEAEVINGIYNEETFEFLSDYEKVKYKALYFEIQEKYESAIELLLSEIENFYHDDKTLQLSLLAALRDDKQFDRYLHYYKKFTKDSDDEFFLMNYILFLDRSDQKDKAISEIKKLKNVVNNSLVLYEFLTLLLKYNLVDELDDFFEKVDKEVYKINGLQMPSVQYYKLMHLLKTEKYEEFFVEYETKNLDNISPIHKATLKANYYIFKGDLDNTAIAYFELFKVTENHNDLLNAVELKLNCNKLYDAEMYIEYINPMLLDKPELYYIFYAIILQEKGLLDEAFLKLHEIIDFVKDDLGSPFHQFYTAFCMNNGRHEDAFEYMAKYYAKNPNPDWFKVIQHSEDDTGEDLIKKLETAIGGKREIGQINQFFNQGLIGVSVYSKITGTSIEEVLLSQNYPFTSVHIAKGDIQKTRKDVKMINERILIDAATLTILSEVNALSLLESFDKVFIPYSTITLLKQRESGISRSASKDILKYIRSSMNFQQVPVEVGLKINRDRTKLYPEDILDCIALSEDLKIPFINTEVSIYREFNPNFTIDLNSLFLYLKENKPDKRVNVAEAISKLKGHQVEFISFDSTDFCINYSINGIDGINSFLRMGKKADYKTFISVYISALFELEQQVNKEEFEELAGKVVNFLDRYTGKVKHYIYLITQDYPEVENEFGKLMTKCSAKEILNIYKLVKENPFNFLSYLQIINSYDFTKIIHITSSFVSFVIQFLTGFGNTRDKLDYYIHFLKENVKKNSAPDIDYIVSRFLVPNNVDRKSDLE